MSQEFSSHGHPTAVYQQVNTLVTKKAFIIILVNLLLIEEHI